MFPGMMVEKTQTVALRSARPDDAPDAARLIHAAGPALYRLLFGPRDEDVLRLFVSLFRLPRNPFSYENGLVAEQDGRIIGLALYADAAYRRRIGRRMFWLALRYRGPFALLRRLPDALDVMACVSTPPPGAFYLSILAVDPECRGQGIGSRLLEEVHRRAADAGSPGVALHAELDNTAAQRLYQRHGYVETARKASRRVHHRGVSGFVAMYRSHAEQAP